MSAALYRVRKRIVEMPTDGVGEYVHRKDVLKVIDDEMEDEAERFYFRPLVSAEPPKDKDD